MMQVDKYGVFKSRDVPNFLELLQYASIPYITENYSLKKPILRKRSRASIYIEAIVMWMGYYTLH